jgi:RNA polymerase primary sigma factor
MASRMDSWDGSSVYNLYIKDIQKYPLLTRKEERVVLDALARGDEAAAHKLVVSNLRFVVNVAFMYRNQGLSLPELINEGNLGLIEAARRFDTTRDLKFISYAVWWIRQSITRAIAEKARMVRISAEKELVLRRFSRVNSSMTQTIGGTYVTDAETVGQRLGMSADQVDKVIEMGQRHASLDTKIDDEGESSLLDLISDDEETRPDAVFERNAELDNLHAMIDSLGDLERKVLSMYFGIGYGEPFNLQQIGKVVGLSKERVRQIKEKALARLRTRAEEMALAA